MTTSTADRWRDAEFLDRAVAWTDEHLAALGLPRTGAVEQPHVQTWGTVLRVPTASGPVWFKAVADELRQEAAVHALLAARTPDRVPPLLAADEATGWMLMADAGERLREVVEREHSLERWHDVLDAVARLQVAAVPDVPRFVAAGVPHYRLDDLAARYRELVDALDVEQRFRDAADQVEEQAARLAALGLPDTIQHDDLHDAQVFVRGGTHLVMDWGDACVSHPFFTLSVTLLGVIAWGVDDEEGSEDVVPYRDSYLAPFAEAYDTDPADLARAADVATRLGWALRAVNGHVQGDDASTRTRLAMFVDGRP